MVSKDVVKIDCSKGRVESMQLAQCVLTLSLFPIMQFHSKLCSTVQNKRRLALWIGARQGRIPLCWSRNMVASGAMSPTAAFFTSSSSSNQQGHQNPYQQQRLQHLQRGAMATAFLAMPAMLMYSRSNDDDDDEKKKLAIPSRSNTLVNNSSTLCEVPQQKLRVGLRETRRPTLHTRRTQRWSAAMENANAATSNIDTAPSTPSPSTTIKEAGMSNFQVLEKLEEKQELEMVRMAKVLHDLHELATDMTMVSIATNPPKETRMGRIQRVRRFFLRPFRRTTAPKTNNTATISTNTNKANIVATAENIATTDQSSGNGVSNMSLRGVNLFELSPQRTQQLIQGLLSGEHIFDQESLLLLLEAAETALKRDETLIDLRGVVDDVAVVGDLHGSLQSLSNVLRLIGYDIGDDGDGRETTTKAKSTASSSIAPRQAVIFNGDFVDRGSNSIEVICILLLLKLTQPKQVILLRGNHEDTLVASAYGFQDEVRAKYGANPNDMPSLWGALCRVFSALPICVRTECAAILHGGIPSDHFSLADVQAISAEERCQVMTTVEAKDDVTRLLEGILWSDPSPQPGIHPNSRGCGVLFGPEITRDFLERHDLLYLIRSHEVAETGTKILDCGGGRAVLTVFSSAAYPDGEGFNLGAVIHVDKEGGCHSAEFSHEECVHDNAVKDPYGGALRNLITASRRKLEKAFQSLSIAIHADNKDGEVTPEQWAAVMSETLELPDIPWMALQPFLAPTTERDGDRILWRVFLDTHSASLSTESSNKAPTDSGVQGALDGVAMEILYANHSMLVTVFKFFDVNGNGRISLQEFKTGINLLNNRLPGDKQIKDPEELFHALDLHGTGSIELEEFTEVFRVL
jgi:serine/threonine-protein phosphatase with EF-hand domain